MSKILFMDLETTGFSSKVDQILEIAAIQYDDGCMKQGDIFHEYIKPNKPIPYKITEITGITNEQVSRCRKEYPVLVDFLSWVRHYNPDIIVGHNCKTFDLRFIRDKCAYYDLPFKEPNAICDTLTLSRQLNKQGKISVENCKQTTLADYFGIKYTAHSALEDTAALGRIYFKLKELENPSSDELGF